ncbi:MAG: hypothetical protein ABSF22_14910 [Bryobacteraceae bacterium]|jgi:hypothetical protein
MKFAVSIALVILLLGMPLDCILAKCQLPAPCCPRTNTSFKCPYDALDSAKIVHVAAIANVPVMPVAGLVPAVTNIQWEQSSPTVEDRSDLYILNRLLRI